MNIAVVFAGGSGVRMGSGIPKQFLEINGKPIIVYTLQLFQYHDKIDKIYLSVLERYIPYMNMLIEEYRLQKVAQVLPGGETAQDSIYHALKAAERENPQDSIVLIHDGVRPFVSYEVISNNIESVKEHGNGITCTPCYETIMISSDGKEVGQVPYRKETFAAQAPQSFYFKDVYEAHLAGETMPYAITIDTCSLMTELGRRLHLVPCETTNIKITTPEDYYIFKALVDLRESQEIFGL